jgi:hypothetical protein
MRATKKIKIKSLINNIKRGGEREKKKKKKKKKKVTAMNGEEMNEKFTLSIP